MKILPKDLAAVMECDPAVSSEEQAIQFHMGLHVVAMYREAHELWKQGRKEEAMRINYECHSKFGADVHPAAEIGEYFFIDHATGVVIGETSVIGERVKLYQGVTIGALSTRGGQKLKGVKRHPTIEDNVTIYSGASILGGETVIGRNSVIGGNSFITQSIKPNTRVSIKNQELQLDERDGETFCERDMSPGAWFYTI